MPPIYRLMDRNRLHGANTPAHHTPEKLKQNKTSGHARALKESHQDRLDLTTDQEVGGSSPSELAFRIPCMRELRVRFARRFLERAHYVGLIVFGEHLS